MSLVLPPTPPEILAPAGGRAQFYAALNAGADAVYLGLKGFNARARAENFTADDLRELVPLAHAHGMKVLVTLNVLVKEAELSDLVETMAALEEIAVDAVIVQDVAVATLARDLFPGLRVHASTQMAVHNLAGVRAAAALGIRRVVLARELTAQELRLIRAEIPRSEVEIEVFCHGSLCYSYSGLCFFSGAEDARSGNRGECAYTCRQPYKIVSEAGHGFVFSMRDLDTSASLDLLVGAGIDALKIEGRKKDAQYVATTVRLYRRKLDELYGRATLRPEAPAAAHELAAAGAGASDPRDDLAYTFQRRTTSLFLKGRYVENVIDLDNPTHAGVLAGTVRKVSEADGVRRVTLKASCPLERFDGLRLEPASRGFHALPQDGSEVTSDPRGLAERYERKLPEFSLRDLFVSGRRTATARAGSEVEIELPPEVAVPAVGDVVRKIRSADVKRRIERLAQAPADTRPTAFLQISLDVDATPDDGGRLRITAKAKRLGTELASASITVDAQRVRGDGDLAADVGGLFAVLGDVGFAADVVRFHGERTWFVRRGQLKQLKRAMQEDLKGAWNAWAAARRDRALSIAAPAAAPSAVARAAGPSEFLLKSDRVDVLRQAVAAAKAGGLAVAELIFEPKRSFIADPNPAALVEALLALSSEAGAPIRLAVPTVVRAWDEALLKRWFGAASQRGIRHFEAGNIGARALLASWSIPLDTADVSGDFTAYALNALATRAWRQQGLSGVCLSLEDDAGNLRQHMARLTDAERASMIAILYKDTPLFIAESCSLTALHNGCPTAAVCGYRSLEIENPKGERFHVAHESCKSIVYGQEAFALAHRRTELEAMGVRRFRVDFLTRPYTPEAVGTVLSSVAARTQVPGTHEANFSRSLL
jgi:putative protease